MMDLPNTTEHRVSGTTVGYRLAAGPENCGNCCMFHNGRCDLVIPPTDDQHVCNEHCS